MSVIASDKETRTRGFQEVASLKAGTLCKPVGSLKDAEVPKGKLCCQLKMSPGGVCEGGVARKAVEHFLPVGAVLRTCDGHDESHHHHHCTNRKHDAGHYLIHVCPWLLGQFQITG